MYVCTSSSRRRFFASSPQGVWEGGGMARGEKIEGLLLRAPPSLSPPPLPRTPCLPPQSGLETRSITNPGPVQSGPSSPAPSPQFPSLSPSLRPARRPPWLCS